jgi:hypothetical protein
MTAVHDWSHREEFSGLAQGLAHAALGAGPPSPASASGFPAQNPTLDRLSYSDREQLEGVSRGDLGIHDIDKKNLSLNE